jgi:hypothetical protein
MTRRKRSRRLRSRQGVLSPVSPILPSSNDQRPDDFLFGTDELEHGDPWGESIDREPCRTGEDPVFTRSPNSSRHQRRATGTPPRNR